jgi:1-acyl-sn-glycerol-3-phosphate acyltransferase
MAHGQPGDRRAPTGWPIWPGSTNAPALIFAPNHHSHVDTPLMHVAVPEPWRSNLVIAAAADYFFDKRMEGQRLAALALNAFPIDREVTSRK